MNKKIAFIGLGNMGINMAKNLISEGYYLKVYNRTLSKADELESASVTKCETPAEAAKDMDIVISMLSEDSVLKEIVSGDEGILKTMSKNSLHISMSTIGTDTAKELFDKHAEAGVKYLSAPVFGRPNAAAERKLNICVSGDQQSKEIAKPVLECLGQAIYDFGEDITAANVVKIAGNFMILATMEMMSEAFAMAEKSGLDREKFAEFFGSTLFNAPVYHNYGKMIAMKNYEPVGFKARLGYKDARLALRTSQSSETPMPMLTLVHNRLMSAVARGLGDRDWSEGIADGVSVDAGL